MTTNIKQSFSLNTTAATADRTISSHCD